MERVRRATDFVAEKRTTWKCIVEKAAWRGGLWGGNGEVKTCQRTALYWTRDDPVKRAHRGAGGGGGCKSGAPRPTGTT